MTIPKHAGLSRLAEAASPVEYYPVKRRGQRRRLTPNWDAINWLERETETDCEISDEAPLDFGMTRIIALGWFSAKRRGMHPRRMFDIFGLEASSSSTVAYPKPCPDCLDFSRTWACTEHPEIPWDTERRVWVRPGTPIWYELHPEDRPAEPEPQPTAYVDTGANGLYDRLIEMFGQPLPSSGFTVRQADQEAYRRQAAFYFRAGGEVGAGFFRGREVSFDEVSADERLAAEWERQNGIPLADVLRRLPDEPAPRRSILASLYERCATTFTLEITSDTTEASVRIEVERDGDTTP